MDRVTTIDEDSPIDAVLERLPQLHRLAHALTHDPAAADDLVQSTVEIALRKPPTLRAAWPSWLGRVMTNLARQRGRGEVRRRWRERLVAAPEALESTSALVERHDIRVRLMHAVRALDEPYRRAVLLRYFEDLPVRAIAARDGIPHKTVESRLTRGLAKLRERLDHEHAGDRRAWLVALAPFAKAMHTPLTLAGVVVMKSFAVSLGVLTLVCTSWWMLQDDEPATPPTPPTAAAAERNEAHDATPTPSAPPNEIARTATPTEPASEAPAVPLLRGLVLDTEGKPVGGVRLSVAVRDATALEFTLVSDADGRFSLPAREAALDIAAADPRYTTVLEAAIMRTPNLAQPREVHVIVAANTRIEGQAVDPSGTPIAEVAVELAPPDAVRALFAIDLSANRARTLTASTDANGRFVFEAAPAVAGSLCSGTKSGYVAATEVVRTFPRSDLRLVLSRPTDQATLRGIVYDPTGIPLEAAYLALGSLPTRSDANGMFTFEYPRAEPPERLLAVAPGLSARTLERPTEEWPAFVELRFEGAAPSIDGVVYGPDGQPKPGANVWIDEPTVFGQSNGNFWLAECITSGSTAMQHGATTDAAGRFRIEGLVQREYGLRAVIPELAWQIDAGRAQAGDAGVEIRFPTASLHGRIEGRVQDGRGHPVADIDVRVTAMLPVAADPVSLQRFFDSVVGSTSRSRADGRFTLNDVPIGAQIEAIGPGLEMDPTWTVPTTLPDPIVLQVYRRFAFRVELTSTPPGAAYVALRDVDDREVPMTRFSPGRVDVLPRVALVDGRSERMTTQDRATQLLVLDERFAELVRIPITYAGDEVTVVR